MVRLESCFTAITFTSAAVVVRMMAHDIQQDRKTKTAPDQDSLNGRRRSLGQEEDDKRNGKTDQ